MQVKDCKLWAKISIAVAKFELELAGKISELK